MAEQNYMAMLDMGLRQTEQVFSRIDEAVTKSFALQENRRQAEAELELKGTQFAAEMAFNDRQLDMEQQKNIMLAENYKLDNEIKSKRFIEEMKLQPLKVEAARMEMEVARINRMTAFTKAKESQFSSLVGNIDAIAAGRIAETNDPNLAEAYMSLRSQEAASIGAGSAYNEAAFSSKVKNLLDTYEAKAVDGYSEGVASSLDKLSPNAAQRYRGANLPNSPSLYSLESGYITGGEKGEEMYLNSDSRKKQNAEREYQIVQAREGYQAEKNMAAQAAEELRQMRSGFNSMDEKDKLEQQKRIDEKFKEFQQHEAAARKIFGQAMGVDIPDAPLSPEATEAAARELELKKKEEEGKKDREDTSKQIIQNTPISEFDPNSTLLNKQQLVPAFTMRFPEAFDVEPETPAGNIKLQYLYGIDARKDSKANVEALTKNILGNLTNTYLYRTKDNPEKTIEDLVKEPAFAELIKSLDQKPVYTSDPKGYGSLVIGNETTAKKVFNVATFEGLGESVTKISSYKDFLDAVQDHSDREYDRMLYAKKLYATILAAGVIDQMSK